MVGGLVQGRSEGRTVGGCDWHTGLEPASGHAAAGPSQGGGLTTQRFEARVPAATPDAAGVGPALNQAANQIAADVARWVGGA